MLDGLSTRQLMTTEEIDNFLSSVIDPIISYDNGRLDRLKNKLVSLRSSSLKLEQEAYSKFGVKSLLHL
jgi:hypothetical protein